MPLCLSLVCQHSSSSLSHVQNAGLHPLLWAARPLASGARFKYFASCFHRLHGLSVLRRPAYGRSAARGSKNTRSGNGCYGRHVVAIKNAGRVQQPQAHPRQLVCAETEYLAPGQRRVLLFPWKRNLLPSHMGSKVGAKALSKHSGIASNAARPNPSIEGTASGLRPPAAPHVKR
jgi:hypothetical protein